MRMNKTFPILLTLSFLLFPFLCAPPAASAVEKNVNLSISVRNASYPQQDPGGNKLQVEQYKLRERTITIPVKQTALILIDTWEIENDRQSGINDIMSELAARDILPVLKAARKADMVVLHATHRPIGWDGINQQKQTSDLRGPADTPRAALPPWLDMNKVPESQWPPPKFIFRVGEYAQYSRFSYPAYIPYPHITGLQKTLRPMRREREYMTSSLQEAVNIFRKEKILHIFYVGTATNQCVVDRPVGIRKMAGLGFNTMIIRDATLGSELADTWSSKMVTEAAILDIEINHGFSVSRDDFLKALNDLPD